MELFSCLACLNSGYKQNENRRSFWNGEVFWIAAIDVIGPLLFDGVASPTITSRAEMCQRCNLTREGNDNKKGKDTRNRCYSLIDNNHRQLHLLSIWCQRRCTLDNSIHRPIKSFLSPILANNDTRVELLMHIFVETNVNIQSLLTRGGADQSPYFL